MRITKTDVRIAFGHLCRELATLFGIDTTAWRLHEGSAPHGVAYRIHTHGPSGGLPPVRIGQNGGRLGATAAEGFTTISTMRDTLALIAAHGRPQVPPPSTPDGRAGDPAQRATRASDRAHA